MSSGKQIKISDKLTFDGSRQLLIAGNCVLENKAIAFKTAEFLKELALKLDVDLVFKASYKKDNRSSEKYFSGMPLPEALKIFSEIKQEFDVPVISDVHYPSELAEGVGEVMDILQVPAYLAMQTELVMSLAKTGKPINIKKPQFLHPEGMENICRKVESTGNHSILLTERGTCFGYRDLIVDPRSFHIMKSHGYPVIFDAGHSIRKYGIPSSNPTGGTKHFLPTMMSACAAMDIAGLFIEVHPDPSNALCDAASQLSFDEASRLLKRYFKIAQYVKDLRGE
ncbi:MAG: 3-deoxy-8-phosphooctulonate synthase [SAR324 cluster bacterium]|uniref:3-deoxy-8-phosphooctulonate synthase n=1 Tax=SAR324 cluster bacterium TaxID=2024889 RepID=A0A2A4T3P0_9DELT|nr:MAG: 3-deoxy-8-phosphooctulonate synthase [SAR324 cluster bacterium]